MQPTRTIYRLAHSPKDFSTCHRIAKERGMDSKSFTFPTVVAERFGQIIGFLATQSSSQYIIAGPLVAISPRPVIAVMRLLEAYENVLRLAGVQAYWFHLDSDNQKWKSIIEEIQELFSGNITHYQDSEKGTWYQRRL